VEAGDGLSGVRACNGSLQPGCGAAPRLDLILRISRATPEFPVPRVGEFKVLLSLSDSAPFVLSNWLLKMAISETSRSNSLSAMDKSG
jgi:hypothetical protein